MRRKPISAAQYYLEITEQEEKCLRIIENTPGISTTGIQKFVKAKSYPSLSRGLNEMERAGYLNKELDGPYSRWTINQKSYASEVLRAFST